MMPVASETADQEIVNGVCTLSPDAGAIGDGARGTAERPTTKAPNIASVATSAQRGKRFFMLRRQSKASATMNSALRQQIAVTRRGGCYAWRNRIRSA